MLWRRPISAHLNIGSLLPELPVLPTHMNNSSYSGMLASCTTHPLEPLHRTPNVTPACHNTKRRPPSARGLPLYNHTPRKPPTQKKRHHLACTHLTPKLPANTSPLKTFTMPARGRFRDQTTRCVNVAMPRRCNCTASATPRGFSCLMASPVHFPPIVGSSGAL